MATDSRIGTEFAGYRIAELIGRGGMGVVYRAEHVGLRRRAALKILAPELSGNELFRQRFAEESRMAASIDHPNIIPIYEAGEFEGTLFIAMRYVEGADLRTLLRTDGPLSPDRASHILGPIADALDAAHAIDLVHRDVKSANILVSRRDDHAYLSDFGLTKHVLSTSGLTRTGQFLGTPDYVAPEQVTGEMVDGRADQYAFACVAFEALSGHVPYERDSDLAALFAHVNAEPPDVRERRPDLPQSLTHVLRRGLAKAPADRYPDCRALMAAVVDAFRGRLVMPAGSADVTVGSPVAADLTKETMWPAPAGVGVSDLPRVVKPRPAADRSRHIAIGVVGGAFALVIAGTGLAAWIGGSSTPTLPVGTNSAIGSTQPSGSAGGTASSFAPATFDLESVSPSGGAAASPSGTPPGGSSPAATAYATPKPTSAPTSAPTAAPTPKPTVKPTAQPTAAPTPAPTAAPSAARMLSPADGATLSGSSVTFTWQAKSNVRYYSVYAGSTVGGYDFACACGLPPSQTSVSINGLPTDGSTLYVRLYTKFEPESGPLLFRDYTYTTGP